jgi:hypothetical protein
MNGEEATPGPSPYRRGGDAPRPSVQSSELLTAYAHVALGSSPCRSPSCLAPGTGDHHFSIPSLRLRGSSAINSSTTAHTTQGSAIRQWWRKHSSPPALSRPGAKSSLRRSPLEMSVQPATGCGVSKLISQCLHKAQADGTAPFNSDHDGHRNKEVKPTHILLEEPGQVPCWKPLAGVSCPPVAQEVTMDPNAIWHQGP